MSNGYAERAMRSIIEESGSMGMGKASSLSSWRADYEHRRPLLYRAPVYPHQLRVLLNGQLNRGSESSRDALCHIVRGAWLRQTLRLAHRM